MKPTRRFRKAMVMSSIGFREAFDCMLAEGVARVLQSRPINSSQRQSKALCTRIKVVTRMFSLPASIFCTVRGFTPTSSAKRSWVSFDRCRSRRTFPPMA